MKIAICDDSIDQIRLIRGALMQYMQAHSQENLEVVEYDNSLLFLESLDQTGGYDIALLDIYMPGITGLEVAKEIRARQDHTEIIFLTYSADFAVDAFALNAVHYIIKPFTQAGFSEGMDRAMIRFTQHNAKFLPLILKNGSALRLDIDEMLYIESFGHEKIVHLKSGATTGLRLSLAELLVQLESLSPGQFIVPCKGYIVNQKAIRTVRPTGIVLYNEAVIPIATRSFRKVREQFFDYIFRAAAGE